MRSSTRVDMLRGVFSERTFSPGEITKIQRKALAEAISGKKGLPGSARSDANASGDILPLPILPWIDALRPELIRKVV